VFEDDHETSFLLRFIDVEFGISNFKLLLDIDICNGAFRLYFHLFF